MRLLSSAFWRASASVTSGYGPSPIEVRRPSILTRCRHVFVIRPVAVRWTRRLRPRPPRPSPYPPGRPMERTKAAVSVLGRLTMRSFLEVCITYCNTTRERIHRIATRLQETARFRMSRGKRWHTGCYGTLTGLRCTTSDRDGEVRLRPHGSAPQGALRTRRLEDRQDGAPVLPARGRGTTQEGAGSAPEASQLSSNLAGVI